MRPICTESFDFMGASYFAGAPNFDLLRQTIGPMTQNHELHFLLFISTVKKYMLSTTQSIYIRLSRLQTYLPRLELFSLKS